MSKSADPSSDGAGPSPDRPVAEAIRSRRSMRGFLPCPVGRDTVERLLALASRAPSGSNIQPWKAHVITGEALRGLTEELLAAHDAGEPEAREYNYYPVIWREPYLARRRKVGWQMFEAAGIPRGDREGVHRQRGRNYIFFGAPVGLVFTIDRDLQHGSWLDFGMFLQTLMIAARGEGLDTCPQAAIANYPAIVRRRLGIEDSVILVCGMALGWADPEERTSAFDTEREPVTSFTTFHEEG